MPEVAGSVETHGSPWHEGELRLQRATGVAERMEAAGRRVIRDHLIDQHRAFFRELNSVVIGTVDDAGAPWATIRAGEPGFLFSPDAHHLHMALAPLAADPADGGIREGRSIALLGIDFSNRRRNRLNGGILRTSATGFDIAVDQSFGNCPKYISLRHARVDRSNGALLADPPVENDRIADATAALIRRSDCFFVATAAELGNGRIAVDVSHRGGRPGFVKIGKDGVLMIPDFVGNFFFNTLGNMLVRPAAGLLFIDFERGSLLHMTGDAGVLLDTANLETFEGAARFWWFRPRRILYRSRALPIRWEAIENGASPATAATGTWPGGVAA